MMQKNFASSSLFSFRLCLVVVVEYEGSQNVKLWIGSHSYGEQVNNISCITSFLIAVVSLVDGLRSALPIQIVAPIVSVHFPFCEVDNVLPDHSEIVLSHLYSNNSLDLCPKSYCPLMIQANNSVLTMYRY